MKYFYSLLFWLMLAVTQDQIGIAAAVNGAAQVNGHAHSTIGNANDQVGISTSYILSLSANDQVPMSVVNHTAARDLDIIHASLTIKMIGFS